MILGLLMIAMWVYFILAGQVPELETRPVEIILHLVAELLTGSFLIVGGLLLRRNHRRGKLIASYAFGLLAYTLIVSPGYYVAQGLFFVGIPFGFLLLMDLFCMLVLWKE